MLSLKIKNLSSSLKTKAPRLQTVTLCLLAISFILLTQISAFAADSTAVDTSVIAYGARSIAMGRTSSALALGSVSMFSNPAGITTAAPWGITSMSTRLLQCVSYQAVAATLNYGAGTFGVGWLGGSTSAGYYTTDEDSLDSAQPISYADNTFVLSYATKLNDQLKNPRSIGDLSLGLNLKLLNKGFSGSGVDGSNGSGYAFDLGLILDKGDGTVIGATLSNLLSSVSWASGYTESLESSFALGAAKKFADGKLSLAADADIPFAAYPTTLHVGAEYLPFSMIAVRAGIDQDASTSGENSGTVATNLTAGIGINYEGFSFDYAYHQDSTLSDNVTHYFSLSYSPEVVVTKAQTIENTGVSLPETSTQAQTLTEPAKTNTTSTSVDADLAELMELDK
jgi:hypothetical protein